MPDGRYAVIPSNEIEPDHIDALLPRIEKVGAQGARVLLKWDGERTHRRCTVVITRQDTDFVCRRDTDDTGSALLDALTECEACHAQ